MTLVSQLVSFLCRADVGQFKHPRFAGSDPDRKRCDPSVDIYSSCFWTLYPSQVAQPSVVKSILKFSDKILEENEHLHMARLQSHTVQRLMNSRG